MGKTNKEQTKSGEQLILAELQKNSNENLDSMAGRMGFSRQKIWQLIKKLEKNHMIWGYTAIVGEEKYDLHHYTLLIKRTSRQLYEKTVNIITLRTLEEAVSELGVRIESSYYVHGEYDWIITFTAPDLLKAKKITDSIASLHPGIVQKTILLETLFIVKNHHILNPEPQKLKKFI